MKEGWIYKKLGEIAFYPSQRVSVSRLNVGDYVGVENLIKNRGGVSFGTEQPNIDSAIAYQKDDILIGNIRPYLHKIWLADKNGGASGDIVLVRVRDEWVDKIRPSYLFKVLSTDLFFEYDNANTKGAKMPRGDRNAIANYIIPIPSITEQDRIVTELDLLRSILDKQNQQLKELDHLAQSIFFKTFSNILDSETSTTLKDVASYRIGLTYKPSDVADEGIVVLRSSNIQENDLDFNDVVRVNLKVDPKKIVNDGDILMCARNGSARLVGKVARIKNLDEEMAFGAFMTIISSKYNDFLFYFFLSDYFRSQLTSSQTATVNQITTKMLDEIKLNVPSLEQQSEFASKIRAIDFQKESINRSIAETQKLFDYTMDKYFG